MTFPHFWFIMGTMKDFLRKVWKDKRVRFLFVGCLNTVVGIGVTYLVYILFGYSVIYPDSIPPSVKFVATLAGQVIGGVHSYLWNKFFTFRSKSRSFGEFVRFAVVCAAQYAVNYLLTLLFSSFISRAWIYTIVVTAICTVVSYLGHNFFSFAQKKDRREEKEEENSL